MRYILLLTLALLWTDFVCAQSYPNANIIELDSVISKRDIYTDEKIERINAIHNSLSFINPMDAETRYNIYLKLYNEYRTFHYDSAFLYVKKLQNLAYQLQDQQKISQSKMQTGFILLSSGMFKETFDTLRTVKVHALSDTLKFEYYSLMGTAYYNLGDYNKDKYYTTIYNRKGNAYLDSALSFCNPASYRYLYLKGLRDLKQGKVKEAKAAFTTILNKYKLSHHEYAIVASTLSDVYILEDEFDSAMNLLAKAVIADIKAATKETTAILHLAELVYKSGDVVKAYDYIRYAMEDAVFYGARQRKIQVGAILPIIAGDKLDSIEEQRRALFLYSSIITVLSLLVVVFAVIIFKQLRKLKTAEKIILKTNATLKALNHNLTEANKIKEEYIGYYFNINSEYIDKIERFKKSIDQKLTYRKFDEIQVIVNRINLKKEREELYLSFDKIFLRLFPNFISEFNALFKEEDRVCLPCDQLLNTELRIFALIRMGISENEKIAQILDYSVNTIYTYKTRIKNKSLVANEEFEDRIMQIEAV